MFFYLVQRTLGGKLCAAASLKVLNSIYFVDYEYV